MTTIVRGQGAAVFLDGDTTPIYLQAIDDPRRPERGDTSWRVEEVATGRVIDEYHPGRPRHVARRPLTPFYAKETGNA